MYIQDENNESESLVYLDNELEIFYPHLTKIGIVLDMTRNVTLQHTGHTCTNRGENVMSEGFMVYSFILYN